MTLNDFVNKSFEETFVHPTAIVEEGARLGKGVYVGPNCFVGEGVEIGDGTKLNFNVFLTGNTIIGKNNHFYQFTSIGEAPQDLKYHGEATKLVIGNNNEIREGATIHRGTVQGGGVTSIGDHNLIMVNVHVGHDCRIQNHCIFSADVGLAGHVHVGNGAVIGGLSGVHQFCTIGAHAMLGGASALVQDIPPFVLAQGNHAEPHGINLVGMQRANYDRETMTLVRSIYKTLYKMGLDYSVAVEKIKEMISGKSEIESYFQEFFETSSRGICR